MGVKRPARYDGALVTSALPALPLRPAAPSRAVRLLVADDCPAARRTTLTYLRTLPEVIIQAACENGRVAVETALRDEPDVVLLDLQMPVMSGLEATEIFCNSLPHVGVIVISMQDQIGVREACLAGGADAFIHKDALTTQFPSVLAAVIAATRAPERHRRASGFVTRPLTDLFAPPRPSRPRGTHTPAGKPGRSVLPSGSRHV